MLKAIAQVVGAVAAALAGLAIIERVVPHRVRRAIWHISVPLVRSSAGLIPGWAVVETIGRRSGMPRRVPVGGRLDGDTYWLVAGYASKAHYVRNIEQDSRVRVRVHGRWRSGTAHVCRDDDARRRLRRLNPLNSAYLWLAASDFVTVRIDLDT